MPCVVCGTPETVKAHIVPRSLFRLQNPTGRQVIGNRRDGPGHLFPQSGFWDREILCSDHEQALHAPDDYAFRFCREFVSHATSGAPVTISNPKPAQLVAFAAACIWRMAASRSSGRPAAWLGPYALRIQAMLFEGAAFDPMLLVSRSAYASGSEELKLGVLPHIYRELGIRFWRFVSCGVVFDLKLDNRATPPAMATLAVNAAPEITLYQDFPQQIARDRAIGTSLMLMKLPPRRPES
jgi:hypothetical protein